MIPRSTYLLVVLAACSIGTYAQGTADGIPQKLEKQFPRKVLNDQVAIWTAPSRVRQRDLSWIVPLTFGLGGVVASDTAIASHVSKDAGGMKASGRFSTIGVGALAGTTLATYVLGHAKHDDKLLETGVLGGRAVANTLLLGSAIKLVTRRERPGEGDARGHFWDSGDSFPSMHAMTAFSIASVLTHEYPGTVTKLLAYGTASAVAAARVRADRHFASDVVIGSALGWYVGRQVFRSQHEAKEDADWGTFKSSDGERGTAIGTASAYVPLDSWVYPAFDRLSALGLLQTGFASLRPWTRMECARLLSEAEGLSADFATDGSEGTRIYRALVQEFSLESAALDSGALPQLEVESLYSKVTGIAGPPLRDGYHFAQTIRNDFGRSYSEGLNAYTGLTARANAGPLAFYVRAEYQHTPAAPALSPHTQSAIAAADGLSVAPAQPASGTSNVRLLDAYVSLNIRNNQLSFGKQSLWWGPGSSGPMLFSDNAEPVTMLRLDRVSPFKLPGVLGFIGPIRTEFFIGRLSGHQFVRNQNGQVGQPGVTLSSQPFINGSKVSFKPTPNLEIGIGRTVLFAGPGIPATLEAFWRSIISRSTSNATNDPGDRRTAFDLSYRVPHLRDWLTVYVDSFTEDEPFPLPWTRTAWSPGIYIPKVPHANKLEFRAEGMLSNNRGIFPGFYYFNVRYRSGYTNDGRLLGNTIGREGTGIQLWTNYWFSQRNTLQFSYRGVSVDREFLQGGSVHDFSGALNMALHRDVSLAASVQYERWRFPALAQGPQNNVAASLQLTYTPHWKLH